jgi:uncharacterized repeat protein (TIGR03803 family)
VKSRTSLLFFKNPNVKVARATKGGNMSKLSSWKPIFALFVFCAATAVASPAQTFTVLHSFTNSPDGANPYPGLFMDAPFHDSAGGMGNLYGTTISGACTPYDCGTVFKLDSAGNETVLFSFGSVPSGLDPQNPYGTLVMDTAANLYGTTRDGGAFGYGAVFKVDSLGNETVLHNFALSDGAEPYAGLIMDTAGNLYGTTSAGGQDSCICGTVFKLDPAGNETVLHSFTNADGASPAGDLIMDAAGNLYGTTSGGGSGTVFELIPPSTSTGSWTEIVLHRFNGSDGANPIAGLIMDASGNLYGTARGGGSGTSTTCQGAGGAAGPCSSSTPPATQPSCIASRGAAMGHSRSTDIW